MAAQQHSTLAAVGGFLIAPIAVGAASALVAAPLVATGNEGAQQAAVAVAMGAHVAAIGGAWYAAQKYPQAHSFFRGAMWGEVAGMVLLPLVLGAAVVGGGALLAASAVSGSKPRSLSARLSKPKNQNVALLDSVLRGGWLTS